MTELYDDDDPRVPRRLPFKLEHAVRVNWDGGVPGEMNDILRQAHPYVDHDLRGFTEGRVAFTIADLDAAIEALTTVRDGLRWRLEHQPGMSGNSHRSATVNLLESAINVLRAFWDQVPADDGRARFGTWHPDMDIKVPIR